MGRVCQGGFLDGMPVYIDEDVHQCINGGGQVVGTGGSSGCATSSIAARPMFFRGERQPLRDDDIPELIVLPFRRLRNLMGEHPVVKELLALNREASNAVEHVAATDEDLRGELVSTVISLSQLARAVTSRTESSEVYTGEMHENVTNVARKLSDRVQDPSLTQAIERVVSLAEPFVGKSAAEIRSVLRNGEEDVFLQVNDEQAYDEVVKPITRQFPSAAVIAVAQHAATAISLADIYRIPPDNSVLDIAAFDEARRAIEARAATLSALAGQSHGHTLSVPGGYMHSYQGCDIYYSQADGAHEVHGDIRAKYNALGGAGGVLGLPVTDESGTPDGIGRYNHFSKGGSIYWTPTTGPMMVRGVIRNLWASQGWERGPMGYPVADEYRLPPRSYPQDNPDIAWSLFQNGALFSKGNAVAPTLAADLLPDALRSLVRTFFDRALKQHDSHLGLEAQVDLLAVSDWSYGFWRSSPRTITYHLRGFRDNGWLPDTTFEITIRLRFALAWTMSFTYPTSVSLTAALDWLEVRMSGLGASRELYDGIEQTFYRGGPDPDHTEVPNGAIFITSLPTYVDQTGSGDIAVIDILTTAQGGLQVLVNPLPPSIGAFRQMIAQRQIDAFVQSF